MRNSTLTIVGVTACLASLLMLCGCSDSKSRQASKGLQEAVAKANRLSERAVALMTETTYEAGGQTNPLGSVVKAEDVRVAPAMAPNPKALDALQEAHSLLSGALSKNTDADPQTQSVANTMMGRIESLLGDYHSGSAVAQIQQAMLSVDGSVALLDRVRSQADVVARYDIYLAGSKPASGQDNDSAKRIQALVATVQAEIESLTTAKATAQTAVEAAGGQIKQAQEDISAQQTKLDQWREKPEAAGGEEIVAAMVEKMTALGTAQAELVLQQRKLEEANVRLAALQQLLGAVTGEPAAATMPAETTLNQMLKGIEARNAKAAQDRAAAAAVLDKAKKDMTDATGAMLAAVKGAGEKISQAKKNYDAAVTALSKAKASNDVQVFTSLASAHDGIARLSLMEARMDQGVADLVSHAAKLNVSSLQIEELGKLANAPELYEVAATQFQKSAEAVTQAAGKVDEKLKWAYQGRAAGAWLAVVQLSPQGQRRDLAEKNATSLLATALKDKQHSPYLASVAALEAQMTQALTGPSLVQPSTQPDAATEPAATAPAVE